MHIENNTPVALPIDQAPRAQWEQPTIETFDVADLTLGTGTNNGEGIANVS